MIGGFWKDINGIKASPNIVVVFVKISVIVFQIIACVCNFVIVMGISVTVIVVVSFAAMIKVFSMMKTMMSLSFLSFKLFMLYYWKLICHLFS